MINVSSLAFMAVCILDINEMLQHSIQSVGERCAVIPFSSFIFSALLLLKEGADPHTPVSSGGSLLHLVRTVKTNANVGNTKEKENQLWAQNSVAKCTSDQ